MILRCTLNSRKILWHHQQLEGTLRRLQITEGTLHHLPQIYLEATHLTHQLGIQLAQQVQ